MFFFLDDDVDVARLRARQMSSNANNFYGHGVDPASTRVKNVYDSRHDVQNTIGTKGRVLMDHAIKSDDVVYSNDRNYGKTGWNGKFVYETPNKK